MDQTSTFLPTTTREKNEQRKREREMSYVTWNPDGVGHGAWLLSLSLCSKSREALLIDRKMKFSFSSEDRRNLITVVGGLRPRRLGGPAWGHCQRGAMNLDHVVAGRSQNSLKSQVPDKICTKTVLCFNEKKGLWSVSREPLFKINYSVPRPRLNSDIVCALPQKNQPGPAPFTNFDQIQTKAKSRCWSNQNFIVPFFMLLSKQKTRSLSLSRMWNQTESHQLGGAKRGNSRLSLSWSHLPQGPDPLSFDFLGHWKCIVDTLVEPEHRNWEKSDFFGQKNLRKSKHQAQQSGFNGFLTRPMSPEKLQPAVRNRHNEPTAET